MKILRASVFWFVVLLIAVLWPSRVIGPLDGVPLDRPAEAIALGLLLPWLFWLGRDASRTRAFRAVVLALVAWKGITGFAATQQGLCAVVRAPEALEGAAFSMRIDEPRGFLRSWDLRADLWDDEPRCTAILTRPLRSAVEFPAWFVNITSQMLPARDLAMSVHGFVTDDDGAPRAADFSLTLGKGEWTFDPVVNGRSVWQAPLITTQKPTAIDRAIASWGWLVAPGLCVILLVLLLRSAASALFVSWSAVAWVSAGSVAAVALASAPSPSIQRLCGALAFGALAVHVPAPQRTLRTAAWLIGAPWIAFFAAVSVATVGRLAPYSMDDWLAYQIAGYRIYMNGHWIEGGSPSFDYQPLYRWITGALHLIFGDSSAGELYWDASCLLLGALLAFHLARSRSSYTWGLAAAAMTLATLTIATPWYIIGRGLSEISAAGFAFAAIACLVRARDGNIGWLLGGAAMGALTFYSRLNHVLWVPCLGLVLLPDRVGSDLHSVRAAIVRLPWKRVAVYLTGIAIAIAAFIARTWYFTGKVSLFYGTALRHNDTGLRPWHVFDGEVWSKVGHSLAGLVFMNEPPQPDFRSLVVVIGVLVGMLAVLQRSIARSIPAGLLLVAMSGVLAAFLAHSHGYPGRFTIHLIPLASALTAIAAARVLTPNAFAADGGCRSEQA